MPELVRSLLLAGFAATLLLQRRHRRRVEDSLQETQEHLVLAALAKNLGFVALACHHG